MILDQFLNYNLREVEIFIIGVDEQKEGDEL